MHPFATDPALRLYALTGSLVALHLIVLAAYTGRVRTLHKTFVNPEDAVALKGTQVEADHPDVMRVKRAHQNALENAVPFFAIGLLYALSGPSVIGAQAYFYTFLAMRVLHSIFYLAQKQPFRTITFAIGALATTGMGVHVIRVAIASM